MVLNTAGLIDQFENRSVLETVIMGLGGRLHVNFRKLLTKNS